MGRGHGGGTEGARRGYVLVMYGEGAWGGGMGRGHGEGAWRGHVLDMCMHMCMCMYGPIEGTWKGHGVGMERVWRPDMEATWTWTWTWGEGTEGARRGHVEVTRGEDQLGVQLEGGV